MRLVGEIDKELSLSKDIPTLNAEPLQSVVRSQVQELREFYLKDQDPDRRGMVPPPGQELKDPGLKIVLMYEPELQEMVRIRFISAFDAKINALSFDFRRNDNIALLQ